MWNEFSGVACVACTLQCNLSSLMCKRMSMCAHMWDESGGVACVIYTLKSNVSSL